MRNAAGVCSLIVMSAIATAFGCNPVSIPLKGIYSKSAVQFTSTKSIDSAWSTLAEIFTTNGLPIKK